MSNSEIKIDIVYNLLVFTLRLFNWFYSKVLFFQSKCLAQQCESLKCCLLFLNCKKAIIRSLNSCSENIKTLLKSLWRSTFLLNKNLSMDSATAFCFKCYLKWFSKAPTHIFPEFSDNFWSSSSICLILCLYPDYLPLRINFGLIDSSINCIKFEKIANMLLRKSHYIS